MVCFRVSCETKGSSELALDWQPVNWLIFIAAAYLTYALSRSEWVWRWGGKVYINMLQVVAERTGLHYSSGSFSPRSVEKPLLTGKYRGRQVSVVIDTKGKWGYTGSIMKISLNLDNKPTDELPQGAFFVVGDPRKKSGFQQLFAKNLSSARKKSLTYSNFL